jgi:6-phosphogluconolactonase (cycloisomerase 2 family)
MISSDTCTKWCSLLATVLLATLLALAGCGGTSTIKPPPGGPPGGGGSSAAPEFVYALNGSAGPAVAGFRIDPATGFLTPLLGSPFSLGLPGSVSVSAMAATPLTAFFYVADWFDKQIVVLRADANSGLLTQMATVSVPTLESSSQIRVDPSGKILFVTDPNALRILAFTINSDGTLTAVPGSPFTTLRSVLKLTIDAASHFLFGGEENTVTGFTIGSDGSLTSTTGSPLTVRIGLQNPGQGPAGVRAVIDPSARFLYVVDESFPRVFVYTIGGERTLTPVSGSPFTINIAGVAADITPDGKFLFVGGFGLPFVDAFAIDTNTGALHPVLGSPFPNGTGGSQIADLAVDPSGKFVVTANEQKTNISLFSIGANGALTMVPGSPFPTAPQLISGSPSMVVVTR